MSNEQKTPLARSLPIFAQRKVLDELDKLGYALPGHVVSVSGSIVTVAFDVTGIVLPPVTMPVFGPEYIRYPIQVGDKGVAFPASVSLGSSTGLGSAGSSTTLSTQGNLSTLVWFPIGNKNWASVDPNALVLYGPNGVVIKDSAGHTVCTLTPSGVVLNAQNTVSVTAGTSITLTVGGHSILINSSGVTIDGKVFLAHEHTGVQTGGGISGPVA